MPSKKSKSSKKTQLQPGLHLNTSDLERSTNLTRLLHQHGDISDNEADELIALAQVIDQIIIFCDDICIIHH